MNNLPLFAIDEEERESNDPEQKWNEKKEKMSRIDSSLLIDRYHSTQNFNQNILQNISEDDDEYIQRQSPYSPNTTWLTMKLQISQAR